MVQEKRQPVTPLEYPLADERPTVQRFVTSAGTLYLEDSYTWLGNLDDPEVKAYAAAQNELTANYMAQDGLAAQLTERIEELDKSVTTKSTPSIHGENIIWKQRSPGQEQEVLMMSRPGKKEPAALVDPNTIGEGVSLSWYDVPIKGDYILYALQRKGNGVDEVYLRNTKTGEENHFTTTEMMGIAWDDECEGFIYSQSNGKAYGSKDPTSHQQIYYHRVGATKEEDTLIFDAMDHGLGPKAWLNPKSMNDSHALVDLFYAKTDIRPLLIDLSTGEAKLLNEHQPATHRSLLLDGYIYTHTTYNANFKRLLRTPVHQADRPYEEWEEFLSEDPERVLRKFSFTKDSVVVEYSHNVVSELELRDRHTGQLQQTLPMPEFSSIGSLSTSAESNEFHYMAANYLTPGHMYHFDGNESACVWRDNRSLDPSKYEVTQEWFESLDGVSVPVMLICQRGLLRSVAAKKFVMQEQYAGFANGRHPDKGFTNMTSIWLEEGGILAVPSCRGGDEFGDNWHTAATGPNKYLSITDTVACAAYLKSTGIADKVGLSGGSNGGLVSLGALLQAPDIIDAGDIRVPLTDMLNYLHYSPKAKRWEPEYGNAQNPEQFFWLARYSPYHNAKPGQPYKALFTAGSNDKLVHPVHSLKMVARLQRADGHVLLNLDGASGHGQGRGASHLACIQGMRLAFLMRELEMTGE